MRQHKLPQADDRISSPRTDYGESRPRGLHLMCRMMRRTSTIILARKAKFQRKFCRCRPLRVLHVLNIAELFPVRGCRK
ncbi:hypothetical protein MPTK2_8g13110 [Marchantia polymorpha subsp. ruderalis]